MKQFTIAAAAAAAVLVPSLASAQANPLVDSIRAQHNLIKGNLVKTAEKVPDAVWTFQPTPEVRTFAQIMGHIADSSLAICGAGAGEKAEPLNA